MKYDQAVKHKKEAWEKAHETVLSNYYIIITPAKTEESQKYIEDFIKDPEAFDDNSCKQYCSDEDYEVVSFRKDDNTKDN